MKKVNFKKIALAVLAFTLVCGIGLLSGCGEGKTPESNDAEYKVTVKDGAGNPYTEGVIVKFMQGETAAGMQNVNAEGVAAKTLAKGDYTVELMITSGANLYYDKTDLKLTADKTELEVVLAYEMGTESMTVFGHSIVTNANAEHEAYHVSAGSTHVKLTAGERNYFMFTPTVSGVYEVSTTGEGVVLGYYGTPYYISNMNIDTPVDGKFEINIKDAMISTAETGTTVLVFGIDAEADKTEAVLNIVRIGDQLLGIEDIAVQEYVGQDEAVAYTLPAGAQIKEFDLKAETSKYNFVYNEEDGFYHLDSANGPLVLVRLAEDSQYIHSFKSILENTGVLKYFYDENGEFVKKEGYNTTLLKFIAAADPDEGVYPLNKDLEYIIRNHGEHAGWWDITDPGYIFEDNQGNAIPGINNELGWLLMCCYVG